MENTEILLEYADLVRNLTKPGHKILVGLTPTQCHVWHMATGISGEAGELLDAVKKFAVYEKDLDLVNVIEELGDLEFYMQGLRDGLGISREEVLQFNVRKLSKRYASGAYTDSEAQARADKENGQ